MPSPKPEESEKDFIARFMSSEEAKRDYPDEKQRLAVAYSIYRRKKNEPIVFVKAPITKFWEDDVPSIKGVDTTEKSNQRFIEVVVSGLKEDRDGERMSQEAIDDMIQQFKSGTIPFFPDHGYGEGQRYSWKQIMGVWVDAHQEGDHLKAVLRLNKAHPDSDIFWNYIQEGMPVGFSIGGKPVSEPIEMEVIENDDEPELEKSKTDTT